MIKLYKDSGSWIAGHTGAEGIECMELFGTDQIPTAFTDKADPETVLARIKELNPKSRVMIGT